MIQSGPGGPAALLDSRIARRTIPAVSEPWATFFDVGQTFTSKGSGICCSLEQCLPNLPSRRVTHRYHPSCTAAAAAAWNTWPARPGVGSAAAAAAAAGGGGRLVDVAAVRTASGSASTPWAAAEASG